MKLTPEDQFFDLIQKEALKHGAKFFVSCGEGHEIQTDQFEGEDFSGWLVPLEYAESFHKDWMTSDDQILDRWGEYFTFAEWSIQGESIRINFDAH
ncbi:hypothetical protein [Anaeromassilibacillus senegalensis]|uniref:hypothetical protein n=1 Tax=Anaeromassilibacillus senegalensis TaxID=1673717 RepID=UPI000681D0BA|nr:hypothetical protein [Anaeromassilibacillus senegalensis]